MHEKTRRLYVTLTREEVETKAATLAKAVAEVDELKERKKALTSELSAKEKQLIKDRSEIAECVRTKREKREVDVIRRSNVMLRTWEIVRTDLNEIVESEPMSDLDLKEQRQGKLFKLEGGGKKAVGTDVVTNLGQKLEEAKDRPKKLSGAARRKMKMARETILDPGGDGKTKVSHGFSSDLKPVQT